MIDFKNTSWHFDAIGILAIVGMTVAAVTTTIEPIARQRDALVTRRLDLEGKRVESTELEATRIRLEQQLAIARERLGSGAPELKSPEYLNTRLAEITELIEASGMVIHGTELSEPRSGRWFRAIPVTVRGRGGFTDCATFMHTLHSRMRDIGVAGFHLSRAGDDDQADAVFQVDLVWYAAPMLAEVVGD